MGLEQEGQSVEKAGNGEKAEPMEKEGKTDASGNIIAEAEADMDAKKKKKEIKAIEKQLKDNKKKKTLSQEEVWELEDRLAKLRSETAPPGVVRTRSTLRGVNLVGVYRVCGSRNFVWLA